MALLDLIGLLVEKGALTAKQAQDLRKEISTRKVDAETVLRDSQLVDLQALAQLKSEALKLPLKTFGEEELIPRETLMLIPLQSAQHYEMLAFNKNKSVLEVGMVKPENNEAQQALKFIAQELGLNVKIHLISKSDLDRYLKGYTNFGEEIAQALQILKKQSVETRERVYASSGVVNLEETRGMSAEDTPVIKMVSEIVKNAVNSRASDIHIEPERTRLKVRYRVDGDLSSVLFLPIEVHSAVLTRIKIMANLKIDETRVPQDGRFGALLEGRQIDFRVATFPTSNGEKVAIRILDPETGLKSLEGLGLSSWNLQIINEAMRRPYGMVLVTGPTGSGKTTTLYAVLQLLNKDNVNVVTLEDPVEYFITGINQSQVIPEIGYSFAYGLRSILRQDPDVIMVGEVRDNETAELAVHSALTGHIVLSTLHTNNSIGAIPRLLDLNVQKFLIPATLNIIASQRLVRKLCPDCKRKTELTAEQLKLVEETLTSLPEEFRKTITIARPYAVYEPVGCETCKGKGFLGRTGIYEILRMTPELGELVLKGESETAILEEAKRQKMVSLRQEAVLHLLEGIIPFSEVIKETT